ncbi:Egalitarian protein-like protein [Frankliniella fusca]|uniref:Egalitarian protein-like protein n=1 Tax=Frankliniella fusca TaxID=407009 RepID=A0AAE1LVC3_9NEOP|nr:Egalitarian protein-like protein [Frankliniella fusca]
MDSSEYEMVRNNTLLFFFEKLLAKEGPRTLHDLSCQFGAKGFTKEMRQIAGGSQSGLKKFLTQYPSLFTVEGDHVHVNAFNSAPSNSEDGDRSKRDYAKEAVDYFVNKLLQYGAGTEVPIKSLLGHRSQASPEVRHISGQHVKEFHDFLCRYPEAFIVKEDTVMLKQWEGREPQPFHEIEEPHVDQKIIDRLYLFFAKAVENKGPQLVDQLFQHAVRNLPEESYHHIFQTSQDLATVLKMRSDMFHVQSNLVTLVNPKIKTESSIEAHQTEDQNQANNNTISGNNVNNNQIGTGNLVPLSPLPTPPSANVQNQTLKQRVNSLVMKTLADNSEKDRNIVAASLPSTVTTSTASPTLSAQSVEAYKTKVLQSTRVILNVKESLQVIDDIFSGVKPGRPTVAVSMDCEGINLGTKGQLTSIQLGLMTGQAFIFDLVTCPSLVTAGGLQRLLESPDVVKVSPHLYLLLDSIGRCW